VIVELTPEDVAAVHRELHKLAYLELALDDSRSDRWIKAIVKERVKEIRRLANLFKDFE